MSITMERVPDATTIDDLLDGPASDRRARRTSSSGGRTKARRSRRAVVAAAAFAGAALVSAPGAGASLTVPPPGSGTGLGAGATTATEPVDGLASIWRNWQRTDLGCSTPGARETGWVQMSKDLGQLQWDQQNQFNVCYRGNEGHIEVLWVRVRQFQFGCMQLGTDWTCGNNEDYADWGYHVDFANGTRSSDVAIQTAPHQFNNLDQAAYTGYTWMPNAYQPRGSTSATVWVFHANRQCFGPTTCYDYGRAGWESVQIRLK